MTTNPYEMQTLETSRSAGSIVERCFLMNLDRRDDRLHEWMQQLPQPWPFPDVERFTAIDGRKLSTPEQWRARNGAWGCYRSHLLILEKCLLEGIDSYVVFEDDRRKHKWVTPAKEPSSAGVFVGVQPSESVQLRKPHFS